jgi:uncharacterized protein with PIN domain
MTSATNRSAEPPRFLCDAMLGSLARWLRFFGFDTLFPEPGPEDLELARRAKEEARWLLTRDHELASVGPRSVLIRSEVLEDQLVEVFSRLGLEPEASLEHARCSECNGELETVSREEITDVAPPHVLATAPRFRRCTGCGRIYWPGTHSERIAERMQRIVRTLERCTLER